VVVEAAAAAGRLRICGQPTPCTSCFNLAILILPLVSAFLVDLANAVITLLFLGG
jgi:Na+/glutamate symporter